MAASLRSSSRLLAGPGLLLALCQSPPALAAGCPAAGVSAIQVGTVANVAPGGVRTFTVPLGEGQGVIVDLTDIAPSAAAHGEDGESDEAGSAPARRSLRLCDAAGKLLAPLPGEVFEKGGSVTATPDGERLRFVAGSAGQYLVTVAADDNPREILVRRRDAAVSQAPVIPVRLDGEQTGIASSSAPMVFSFAAPAGQWVELRSTSEKDTLLRLAGPDRAGDYSQIAENDDSDGLNPRIRRRLAVAGTYYVQVDSLSDEPGEFKLALSRMPEPQAVRTVPLRTGQSVTGKLQDADDSRLYSLSVAAGHDYRLDLVAPYDGVIAIGLASPVVTDKESDDSGGDFAELSSQDTNTSGLERLSFTARSAGVLLVRVKCFGIGESDGGYTLIATDLGK